MTIGMQGRGHAFAGAVGLMKMPTLLSMTPRIAVANGVHGCQNFDQEARE
jgi:hypothetical protein